MSADQLRTFREVVNAMVDSVLWDETHPEERGWRPGQPVLIHQIDACKRAFGIRETEYSVSFEENHRRFKHAEAVWPRLCRAIHRAKDERLAAFDAAVSDGMTGHARRGG